MKPTFLIDTNILIQLEETGAKGYLEKPFTSFSEHTKKFGIQVFAHPASVADIERDKDPQRKKETLSRLEKYPKIENVPEAKIDELETLFGGISKPNDLVDCQLLYALKRSCVNFLVSEDDGLHKRARQAGLNERVLSVNEANTTLLRLFQPESVFFPLIREVFVYNLDRNDPIFSSLRIDYDGNNGKEFDEWLNKCCLEQRKAWVVFDNEKIAALCIFKNDNDKEHAEISYPSLKVCTYKVAEDHRGNKLGELLFKTIFEYAKVNSFKSCWLTVFDKHEYFVEFIKDFGFEFAGYKKSGELICKKPLLIPKNMPPIDPLKFHIKYSPHYYDDATIGKHFIPIKPEFHELLFPEISPQMTFQGMLPKGSVPGNTIKKVYLCHSNSTKIKPGDLLFFYRSADQITTTMGIVERAAHYEDANKILDIVGKRSVYTIKEITEMAKKPVLVIEFRQIQHFSKKPALKELISKGVLKAQPQSVSELPHENYIKLQNLI